MDYSKIILALDIDRTLIFSEKGMEECGVKNPNMVKIERTENVTSYIDMRLIDYLKKLFDMGLNIIPVTTRSREQFERVNFDQFGLEFNYAITSNGGIVLQRDNTGKLVEDTNWKRFVSSMIDTNNMNKVYDKLLSYNIVDGSVKVVDNTFLFSKIKKEYINSDLSDFEGLENICRMLRFNITRYRNKLYVTSKSINKGISINYIKNKLNCYNIVSAGDSEFDMEMFKVSSSVIIPGHNTIDLTELNKYSKHVVVESGSDFVLKGVTRVIDRYTNSEGDVTFGNEKMWV